MLCDKLLTEILFVRLNEGADAPALRKDRCRELVQDARLQFYNSSVLQFCICTETNASQFLIFAADQSGLPRWWWGCRWEQVFRFRLGECRCCQHFHDMYIISLPWWSSGKNLWKEMMYEKHKIQQITPWHHEVVSFCSKYLNWLQLKGED